MFAKSTFENTPNFHFNFIYAKNTENNTFLANYLQNCFLAQRWYKELVLVLLFLFILAPLKSHGEQGSEYKKSNNQFTGVSSLLTQNIPDSKITKEISLPSRQRSATEIIVINPMGREDSDAQTKKSTENAPLKIGHGIPISPTDTVDKLLKIWTWETLPDGSHAAAVSFYSAGATGTRLLLDVEYLDPRAILVFSGSMSEEKTQITGYEIKNILFRNLSDSPLGPSSKTYTGPYTEGERVTLEMFLPKEVPIYEQRISIPTISRIITNPVDPNAFEKPNESGSCQFDIKCEPDWVSIGNGVARIIFTDPSEGASFLCTGTLLNDSSNSTTPYFLTANHCISSQNVASTVETFWFYQNTYCGSAVTGSSTQSRSGGALLLNTLSNTDTTLLRLNQTPPPGVSYLGWSTEAVISGSQITGVHHPRGDKQKVSKGYSNGYSICANLYCSSASQTTATHIVVNWTKGVTEPGSSGSGLFIESNGNKKLAGTLTGGTSSCSNSTGFDVYGRFDVPYYQTLYKWLNPSGTLPPANSPPKIPVFRFYNKLTGAHFYTSNVSERDSVVATLPNYIYEGEAFYATNSSDSQGLSPVYRFYNTTTSSHFFTIDQKERDFVATTYRSYNYEGAVWNGKTVGDSTTTPLYRFYNRKTSTHFYTTSSAERDHILGTNPAYQYEGIGYYVWQTK
jgi:hypothetical protein